ncbi:hypothetical protein, partial [Aeromonas allosaccharophila]|uniref:hypothetical protein n=1 Tax=Aeromonas allosaccharophila TaxID=656 RepID=UPI00341D18E6
LSLVFIILVQKALTPCCFVYKSCPFLVVPQPFAALLSVKTGICRGQGASPLLHLDIATLD